MAIDEATDEDLMRAYLQGDPKAFEALYGRYRRKVFGVLRKRVSDVHVCEELFQSIFLKLHRSRYRFEDGRLFSPWLYAIVHHVLCDYFRAQGKLLGRDVLLDESDHASDPEPFVDVQERQDVARLTESLSEVQRQALELRYLHDQPFSSIATQLKMSVVNARQIVSRALHKLRRRYASK